LCLREIQVTGGDNDWRAKANQPVVLL
jgi:hypothetical protein